jgi:hypothetical protein
MSTNDFAVRLRNRDRILGYRSRCHPLDAARGEHAQRVNTGDASPDRTVEAGRRCQTPSCGPMASDTTGNAPARDWHTYPRADAATLRAVLDGNS